MRLFGLVGLTLKHSFSKGFFQGKFAQNHITDCRYENFELSSIDKLPILLKDHPDIEGLNITIPYKEQIIPYLDNKQLVVEKTGACNCIKIINGKLYGFNTDTIGFKNSLVPLLKPDHKRALILGTGGASKAVSYVLDELGIAYNLVSRGKKDGCLSYNDLDGHIMNSHLLIINTTPAGMYPNISNEPPIPYQFISAQHLLYDLIYNPPETNFLKHGKASGAQVYNGQEMLVLQAEESWRIWNSKS